MDDFFAPGADTLPTDQTVPEAPDYVSAANLHNIGANNQSFLDSTISAISNSPEFIATSVLSGINSFYNTGLQVGRIVGLTDEPERETAGWIADIDSDLGEYYRQNKTGADVTGFILGSMIPGLGGIKILNAGQKVLSGARFGLVGTNLDRKSVV